jgi:flagellar M-ring protein FliF
MNEFLQKLFARFGTLWSGWSMVQKVILAGIVIAAAGGVFALFRVSSSPTLSPVLSMPITDENLRDRIITRLDKENVRVTVSAAGVIQVADDATARRMGAILMSEGLVPKEASPWALFNRDSWTLTDFDRKQNLREAIRLTIENYIKALDDVDNAIVNIDVPEKELFRSDQKPMTAAVTIFPRPGSDITQNRKKIEGIQRILKSGISGLEDDHITITDNTGLVLNDFAGMAEMDRLSLIERENKFKQKQEAVYRAVVLSSLQSTFTADRVRDLNIKIDMDMSKKAVDTKESFPVTIKPRTPGLSYDDSVLKDSIVVSESVSETKWEGTGYNPEGPAGVEGQTPPAMKDMSNVFGKMTQTTRTHNEEINQRITKEEKSPQIDRVTVSVNIDGTWALKYDEKGKPVEKADGSREREYIPVPAEEISAAKAMIEKAIGYKTEWGDAVSVVNIKIDRTEQFGAEDAAYQRKKQIQMTVIIFLAGLTLLLVGFIIFRTIQREVERRKRLAEEERARREQMLRESAMAEAEQEGVDVSISVEERTRQELMESVMNMAKEHPDDCAQLIRTWLLED